MVDFSIYAGRWIALTETGTVASVGLTATEARHSGRSNWPKEHLRLMWISEYPPYLPLPEWPLAQLRTIISEWRGRTLSEGRMVSDTHPKDIVWLAGGPVRDLLLGRQIHDWDFAVDGDALKLARYVGDRLGAAYYPLDEERGAGRVVVKVPTTDETITLDFASLRGTSLEEDLGLRDFTINAMALSLDGQLFDPTRGQIDLENRCICITSERSFQNDPARLLRAVRQAATLGFHLASQTELALRAQVASITNVSSERVREEYLRILNISPAAQTLQALKDNGLLHYTFPELYALQTVQQSSPHYYPNAWEHTLATVSAVEDILTLLSGNVHDKTGDLNPCKARNIGSTGLSQFAVPVSRSIWEHLKKALVPWQNELLTYLNDALAPNLLRRDLLKWGALFHDIGKTSTRTVDEQGFTHFYDHEKIGAQQTRARLRALRFSNKAQNFVTTLVEHHMRLVSLSQTEVSRRASYRFYRATNNESNGDAGIAVVLLALADALAVWGHQLEATRWHALLNCTQKLFTHYFQQRDVIIAPSPLLNGHDLLKMGIPQGPQMGHYLDALREAQAAGEITTSEAAISFIYAQIEAQQA
ncbi:MAG: CCA tRNA nucleotidyltransferase [Anaerolineae bacterium]|nr:CCA tRNA nucleotidyltransferase [Anaerolineae bacterium]